MNPLIKKEIRLLLPAWITAMLLAIFALPNPIWARWFEDAPHIGVPLAFVLGFLFLGLQSFGQELSSGTFTALLAQPMARHRIWRVKMSILALAFVSVLFIWAGPREFFSLTRIQESRPWDFPLDLEKHLLLFALTIFSGALWTTLLLRQILGAFWLTLLVPVAIDFLIGFVSDHFNWPGRVGDLVTDAALTAYSIAGFFWARSMFLSAQDTQWTGGNFLFPWRRKSAEQASSFILGPFRNRFLTLIWKEIQLHEVSLFLAIILFFLNIAAVILRPYVSNADYKTALEFAWALWLLIPLVIGCAAVAEERRLGTMESQLCLPVSRRAQFIIKFSLGLFLSVLLGAVMPSIIERTRTFSITTWLDYWIFFAAPAWFCVSFYASTLARSTIQAIGLAIAIPTVAWAFLAAFFRFAFHTDSSDFQDRYELAGRAVGLIYFGVPAFVLLLARLMFWNFKWLHQNRILWRNNIIAVLVSFFSIYALTTALYYRPWELLMPVESARGPVRLNTETPPRLFSTWGQIAATLPDGKLWEENIGERDVGAGKLSSMEWWLLSPQLRSQRFIDGMEGTNVAVTRLFVLAIHQDGSLWGVPQLRHNLDSKQMGSDTNWLKVAARWRSFLLMKKDGTLWSWGTNEPSGEKDYDSYCAKKIKLDFASPPSRIGDETGWADFVSYSPGWVLFEKSDGSIWDRQTTHYGTNVPPHFVECTNLENQWTSYACGYNWSAGINAKGELWFLYQNPTNADWENVQSYLKKVRLASEPVWKAAAFSNSGKLILLRNDGTLWAWTFTRKSNINWSTFKLEPFHPVRLGNHSDWLELLPAEFMGGVALASDGSLWNWDEMSDHIWLAPSRRPVYMGNIFQTVGGNAP